MASQLFCNYTQCHKSALYNVRNCMDLKQIDCRFENRNEPYDEINMKGTI